MERLLNPVVLILVGIILFVLFVLIILWQRKSSRRPPLMSASQDRTKLTPSINETLSLYELRFPEFTNLLKLFLKEVPMERLLQHKEIADALAKLSLLIEKSEESRGKGSIIVTDLKLPAQDMKEAKAVMVTIVRALHDFEQTKERLGTDFQNLEEKFLEALK